MTDRQPDPDPDSRPREDDRGSIESLDRPDAVRTESPEPRNGAVGGTDGVTQNQDDAAQ